VVQSTRLDERRQHFLPFLLLYPQEGPISLKTSFTYTQSDCALSNAPAFNCGWQVTGPMDAAAVAQMSFAYGHEHYTLYNQIAREAFT
jgi:hypothetical protein